MASREEGYYGPSESGLGCGALVLVAFLVASVLLVGALCAISVGEPSGCEGPCADSRSSGGLAIDVTDQWAMQDSGLPTRADVLEWHMCGRWGFGEVVDGVNEVHIWEDLPGGARVWDALYGIDAGNPAFKFR